MVWSIPTIVLRSGVSWNL
jgi:hypothetical protein